MTAAAGRTGVSRSGFVRALPLLLVLAGVALGLILISLDHWRRGATALGASAALGGLLRLVLPEQAVGFLAVRSKAFDVVFAALLTAGAAVLVVQP